MTDAHGIGYSLLTIGGPIVLAIVIAFAVLRNRPSKRSYDETERATRDLYREEDKITRDDKAA